MCWRFGSRLRHASLWCWRGRYSKLWLCIQRFGYVPLHEVLVSHSELHGRSLHIYTRGWNAHTDTCTQGRMQLRMRMQHSLRLLILFFLQREVEGQERSVSSLRVSSYKWCKMFCIYQALNWSIPIFIFYHFLFTQVKGVGVQVRGEQRMRGSGRLNIWFTKVFPLIYHWFLKDDIECGIEERERAKQWCWMLL